MNGGAAAVMDFFIAFSQFGIDGAWSWRWSFAKLLFHTLQTIIWKVEFAVFAARNSDEFGVEIMFKFERIVGALVGDCRVEIDHFFPRKFTEKFEPMICQIRRM